MLGMAVAVRSSGCGDAFALRRGRCEHLEVELLVELGQFALGGRTQQLTGQSGEHAVVACGVLAPYLRKIDGREFPLMSLPLGKAHLRDIRLSVDDNVWRTWIVHQSPRRHGFGSWNLRRAIRSKSPLSGLLVFASGKTIPCSSAPLILSTEDAERSCAISIPISITRSKASIATRQTSVRLVDEKFFRLIQPYFTSIGQY